MYRAPNVIRAAFIAFVDRYHVNNSMIGSAEHDTCVFMISDDTRVLRVDDGDVVGTRYMSCDIDPVEL